MNIIEQFDDGSTLEKYKTGGKIVSNVLDTLVENTTVGTLVSDLCKMGDRLMLEEVDKVYRKKKSMEKGISFPTCVSRNNVAGYCAPYQSLEEIQEGDLVKIELGVHIDGFPAYICYTVLVSENIVSDKRTNVMRACAEASKKVLEIMKSEVETKDIVKVLEDHGKKHNCQLILTDNVNNHTPGVLSSQVSKNVIDGHNDDMYNEEDTSLFIMNREGPDYDFVMENQDLEEDQVFAIDVAYSTGTGKVTRSDHPTTVYKRNHDLHHSLRVKASRTVLSQIKSKFPVNINTITGIPSSRIRLGMKECSENHLLEPYYVYREKEGEFIARTVFTVIVKDKKPILVTGRAADLDKVGAIHEQHK